MQLGNEEIVDQTHFICVIFLPFVTNVLLLLFAFFVVATVSSFVPKVQLLVYFG
jgi:hypothetical protein